MEVGILDFGMGIWEWTVAEQGQWLNKFSG
jgi:hypothetical protein